MAETTTHKLKQPYHLVDPSPWPLVGAISAGVLTAGGVMAMHGLNDWIVILGLVLVLGTMFVWWRDVIREATFKHLHTPMVQLGLRYGMLLFITSEVMFFVAFFWAYFEPALFAGEAIQQTRLEVTGGIWPPKGTLTFDPFDVPFLNTMILLLSGCTVTWAHHALREGDQKGCVQGLTCTVLLGASFTALQAYEYTTAAFSFGDGQIYSSVFYMATGFHGFHVLVGTLFLTVCLFRAKAGHFTPTHHFGLEAAAWYWHFVDVVWLFLFTCIYWAGAGEIAAH